MKPYQPIPCIQHERLEYAALRRIPLRLTYLDGETLTETVIVTDVLTREGAEWLCFRNEHGEDKTLRLDHIAEFQELPL